MSEHLTPENFPSQSTFRDWVVKTQQTAHMWEIKRQEEKKIYQAAHLRKLRAELDFIRKAYEEDR